MKSRCVAMICLCLVAGAVLADGPVLADGVGWKEGKPVLDTTGLDKLPSGQPSQPWPTISHPDRDNEVSFIGIGPRSRLSAEEQEAQSTQWKNAALAALREGLRYPPRGAITRTTGVVVLQFLILPDGEITDCQLTKSSGAQSIDDYTRDSVCTRALPPLPPDLGLLEVSVRFAQGYRYHD